MQGPESDVGRGSPANGSVLRTAVERRRNPRYRPLAASAYIGWWEGDAFRTELVVIQNISLGGVAVGIQTLPGGVSTVWICLVGPGRVTWVPARLLAVEGRVARLQFAEPCGDDLIAPLIWGLT